MHALICDFCAVSAPEHTLLHFLCDGVFQRVFKNCSNEIDHPIAFLATVRVRWNRLKCLKYFNLNANDVIYIGDTLSDYEAAKSAGIDFGYATWGSVSNEGILEPEYIFKEPRDLLHLL